MMSDRLCQLLLACLVAASTSAAAAETLELKTPPYREAFASVAPVSGRVLAGLAFETAGPSFDTGKIRLGLGAVRAFDSVCVRIQSQDGLYWSENSYKLPAQGEAGPGIEIPTDYADNLAGYATDQIGIKATVGEDCSDEQAALVPAIASGAPRFDRLVFHINSGSSRPDVRLADAAGAEIARARCETPRDTATVAFNNRCALDLPDGLAAGRYRLEVTLKARTGGRHIEHFDIDIDRSGLHGS